MLHKHVDLFQPTLLRDAFFLQLKRSTIDVIALKLAGWHLFIGDNLGSCWTSKISAMKKILSPKLLLAVELLVLAFFCFVPLLFNNPYRINIFLSWEGAYRLYLGQIPFKDFGLPMGYGYWVIPALFFKIFGPYFYSLIISQAFINAASVWIFRSILKLLDVKPIVILCSVIVFCFSYVSWNFWPWYNHLVIVLELAGIYFALRAILSTNSKWVIAHLIISAFFMWFAIFTKQDGGILGVAFVLILLAYTAFVDKSVKQLIAFSLAMVVLGCILILPLLPYDFGYWFNYGQAPHNSRIHTMDFLNQILGWAYWEKFFLLVIALLVFDKWRTMPQFIYNKKEVLLALVCIGMIVEALIIQVTSYEPPNGEVFFYAFGFAYCLHALRLSFDLSEARYAVLVLALIVFWWTGIYWRNVRRIIDDKPVIVEKMENKAKHKYRLASEFKTMEKLFLSESTIDGIHKIKNLPVFKEKSNDAKVLNMSELTSLAYEVPFTPLTNQPMWFHRDVSIFQKEIDEFCEKISRHEYDVVIFESIPYSEVVDFFPMDIKECLDQHYKHEFQFLAPRTPEHSFIDVYTRPVQN